MLAAALAGLSAAGAAADKLSVGFNSTRMALSSGHVKCWGRLQRSPA